MADTIPDLWPGAALKSIVLSPVAILRTQATLLGQKTQGLLIAEVTTTTGENGHVELGLELIVPALHNFRYRLLQVRHERDTIYPADIFATGLTYQETRKNLIPLYEETTVTRTTPNKTAYSDDGFIKIIQEVLQAKETVAMLQSLIARSNEEVSTSSSENENVMDTNEQEE